MSGLIRIHCLPSQILSSNQTYFELQKGSMLLTILDWWSSISVWQILYWIIVLNLLMKPIQVAVQEPDRLFDPLGLVIMVIFIGICYGLDTIMYDDDGTDLMNYQWYLIGFAFVWWSLLRFTDEDYDMERSVGRAFRMAKTCPNCMKKLPSHLTSKCPHCTADL